MVISPEHPLVDKITTSVHLPAVKEYQEYAARASEIDRLSTTREKTGVFTGAYAVNPINGRKVPIWTADYVLASYGTGCVMAAVSYTHLDVYKRQVICSVLGAVPTNFSTAFQ